MKISRLILAYAASHFALGASCLAADNFFYIGAEKHELTPAADWIGVKLNQGGQGSTVAAQLSKSGVARGGESSVVHGEQRIMVLPIVPGETAKAQASIAAGVRRPVRVFANGDADPIVETDDIIVRFEPAITRPQAEALLGARGVQLVREMGSFAPNAYLCRVVDGRNGIDVANEIHRERGVAYAHPDLIWPKVARYAPNDPLYAQQWHLNNLGGNGGTVGADIKAERAWEFTRGAPSVVIAILDDGVATDHEDFASAGKITGGWDFVGNDSDPRPGAGQNHGTSCAGLAAADGNNAIGVSGVAPNCRIMPVRMLGPNHTISREAAAISHAKNNGAAIISNSWGPTDGTGAADPCPPIVNDAINDAADNGRGGRGCIIVWAAGNGNESSDLDGYASHPKVICVAATLRNDRRSPYSDFGAGVDVCAPGGSRAGDMVTVDRMGAAGYDSGSNYTTGFNGTSAATPVVSGVIALLLSVEPNLTRSQVYQRLIDSADFIDTANATYDANGHNNRYGFGRVNAWSLLGWNDSTAPSVEVTNIAPNQVFSALYAAEGTVADTGSGVYRMRARVRNRSTDLWWQEGTGAWVSNPDIALQERTGAGGVWSVLLPGMGEGNFELQMQAEDKAGNFSGWVGVDYSIDNGAPTLDIGLPASGNTSTSPAAISGTAGDTGTGIKEIRVALRDASGNRWWNWLGGSWGGATFVWAQNAGLATGTISWSRPLPPLPEGSYEVFAQALDNSDAASEWKPRSFVYDNGNPVINFGTLVEQNPVFDFLVVAGTVSEPGTVAWRLTEVNPGGTDRFWTGTDWTTNAAHPNLWLPTFVSGNNWRPTGIVPGRLTSRYGPYLAEARVTDRAGKVAQTSIVLIRTATDTTVPEVGFSTPAAGAVVTTPTLPTISGTASDTESGIASVTMYLMRAISGGFSYWSGRGWTLTPTELPLATNAGDGTWQAPFSGGVEAWNLPTGRDLINGSWQLQVTAKNGELPVGTRVASRSFVVDYHPVYTWTGESIRDSDPNNDNLYWGNPDNWSPPGIPGVGDVVVIANGDRVDSTISRTVHKLLLSSGHLNFTNGAGPSGTLTTTDGSVWSGGAFSGAWENPPGATLVVSGAAGKELRDGSILNNSGLVDWQGPAPLSAEGNGFVPNAVITNRSGGRYRFSGSGDAFSRNSGRAGNPLLANEAGGIVEAANGTARISTFHFNNAGIIEFTGGATLNLNTATSMLDAAPLTGAGSLVQEGGTFVLKGDLNLSGPQVLFRGGNISGHADNTATFKVGAGGRIRLYGGQFFSQFTVAAGHRIEIEDDPSAPLARVFGDGCVLENRGTVNWRGTTPLVSEGNGFVPNPIFNNRAGATFNASGGTRLFDRVSGRSGAPIFNNEAGAVFRKAPATPTVPILTIDTAVFNNFGSVVCDSGVLEFNTTVNHQSTVPLAGPGTYEFRSGQLGITGPLNVSGTSLFLLGGNIVSVANSAVLSASGAARIHLRGGSYFSRFTVNAGDRLEIDDPSGGAVPRLFRDGFVLDNSGTVTWPGGSAILAQGDGFDPNPVINNKSGGQFLAAADGALFSRASGRAGVPVFNNEPGGVFRKTEGPGQLLFNTFMITNLGSLVCDSGVLAFDATTVNHQSTVPLSGPGTYEFRSGQLGITGPLNVSGTSLFLLGGNIVSVANSAVLSASGAARIHLRGGSYFSRFTVNAGDRLEIDDPSGGAVPRLFRDGFVLDNSGTVTWPGGSAILAQGDGFDPNPVINNKSGGQFLAAADGPLFGRASGRAGVPVFNNQPGASLRKSAGNGDLVVDTFHLINNGALACTSGRMALNTRYVHETTVPLAGPGLFRLGGGTLELRGVLAVEGATFTIAAGDLVMHPDATASFTATNGGFFRAQGGRFFGAWTLGAGTRLDFEAGDAGDTIKFLGDGSVFTNRGHVRWMGGGPIQAEGNGFAVNPIIRNAAGARFEFATGGEPFSRLSGRAGVPRLINEPGAILEHTAAIELKLHTFNIDQQGLARSGAGGVEYNTTLTTTDGCAFEGVGAHRLTAGALHMNGNATARNTRFELSGGTTTGSVAARFTTAGTGEWKWSGGTFAGQFAIPGGSRFLIADPIGGSSVKFLTDGSVIDNSGQIEWSGAGPIQAEGNGFVANPVINNLAGAIFTDQATGVFNRASGRAGVPVFNNHGTVTVGPPAGEWTMQGWNFTQTGTGTLRLDLGGTAATQFDRLRCDGNVSLGGTLTMSLLNGFTPAVGDRFTTMTFGSRSGTFATINGGGGTAFTPEYNAADLTVVAGETAQAQSFAEWAAANFANPNSPEAQPGANIDGDRFTNEEEYAFGGDPKKPDAGVTEPGVDTGGGRLGIVFNRRVGADITYCVCTTNDLGAPVPIATLVPGSSTWSGTGLVTETGNGAIRRVTVKHPTPIAPGARRFLTVRISR